MCSGRFGLTGKVVFWDTAQAESHLPYGRVAAAGILGERPQVDFFDAEAHTGSFYYCLHRSLRA